MVTFLCKIIQTNIVQSTPKSDFTPIVIICTIYWGQVRIFLGKPVEKQSVWV
jgi:hypothetical protein